MRAISQSWTPRKPPILPGRTLSSLRDSKLSLTYNHIEAPLDHWHFETFVALKNAKDPAFEDQKVQFLTNVKGYVDSLAVALEPSLKPIVFTMRPDRRLKDP